MTFSESPVCREIVLSLDAPRPLVITAHSLILKVAPLRGVVHCGGGGNPITRVEWMQTLRRWAAQWRRGWRHSGTSHKGSSSGPGSGYDKNSLN